MFYSLPEDIQWFIMEKVRKMELMDKIREDFDNTLKHNIQQGYKAFVERRRIAYRNITIDYNGENDELVSTARAIFNVVMKPRQTVSFPYPHEDNINHTARAIIVYWYDIEFYDIFDGRFERD